MQEVLFDLLHNFIDKGKKICTKVPSIKIMQKFKIWYE